MIKNKLTTSNNDTKKLAEDLNLNYYAECLNKPKNQNESYRYHLEIAKKNMPIISQNIALDNKFENDKEIVLFLAELCRQIRETEEYKARRKEIFEIRKKIEDLKSTKISAYTQMSKISDLEYELSEKNNLFFAGDESKESMGLGDTSINIGLLERSYRDIRLLNLRVKKGESSSSVNGKSL